MKKLNKLEINPEKIMKNEELLTLRGGYIDKGWLTCRVDGVICWSQSILSCDYAREACDNICGPWSEAICVGW